MRKIPGTVYALVLILFLLSGLGYLAGSGGQAAAESPAAVQPAVQNPEQFNTGQQQTGNGSLGATEPAAEPAGNAVQNGEEQSSATGKYFIDVNISEQKVRIYENEILRKEWSASTGQNDSTPLGRFVIQNRGEWFFSEKYQQGAMWWVSFKDWGVYLFHSLPMDRDQNLLTEEAEKLGTPASHGCVRLEVENAKWIYDHIPQGTEVYIHK